jgi:hypothetical protein
MSPHFVMFWKLWFAAGFLVEMVALFRPARGDTLSEQLWNLRDNPRMVGSFSFLMAILIWSVYHFVKEGKA